MVETVLCVAPFVLVSSSLVGGELMPKLPLLLLLLLPLVLFEYRVNENAHQICLYYYPCGMLEKMVPSFDLKTKGFGN